MEDLSVNVEYTFSSSLGEVEEYRYIKDVNLKVYNGEYADNKHNEFIGIASLKILLLDNAKEDEFDIYQIFDNEEYSFRVGESIYDFEIADFSAVIREHYNDELITDNICIIEKMYIKHAYRGTNIGANLFKNIVYHFGREASLFIIQPFPSQFDNPIAENEMQKDFELHPLVKNKSKAFKKLAAYYESWGFEKIDGIKDLLFFNAELVNEKFNAINLEE